MQHESFLIPPLSQDLITILEDLSDQANLQRILQTPGCDENGLTHIIQMHSSGVSKFFRKEPDIKYSSFAASVTMLLCSGSVKAAIDNTETMCQQNFIYKNRCQARFGPLGSWLTFPQAYKGRQTCSFQPLLPMTDLLNCLFYEVSKGTALRGKSSSHHKPPQGMTIQ